MSLYIFWLVMSFYILDIAKICRMLRFEESLPVQKTQIKVAGKISFRQLKLVIPILCVSVQLALATQPLRGTGKLHRILPHPLIPACVSGENPVPSPQAKRVPCTEALRSIGWGSIFMQLHIKLV
jgi:hypothetical protein